MLPICGVVNLVQIVLSEKVRKKIATAENDPKRSHFQI